MNSIYNLDYEQMEQAALDHGWKKFRGQQIFQWLYRDRVKSFDDMTNLSKETREVLRSEEHTSELQSQR